MKKLFFTLLVVLIIGQLSYCQTTESLINKCVEDAGSDCRYLKDYRIKLGESAENNDLRFKVNISLWKDMKYRITMCCHDDSPGQMILNLTGDSGKLIVSSYDSNTGKIYSSVDFICSKSGIYQLSFDFTGTKEGSGVSVVSLVK